MDRNSNTGSEGPGARGTVGLAHVLAVLPIVFVSLGGLTLPGKPLQLSWGKLQSPKTQSYI